MKKLTLIVLSLGSILFPGCGKKPYHDYQKNYKTQGATQFDDASVDPVQAVKKNIKNMTLQEARAARIYFEHRDDIELIEKALLRIMKLSDNYQERADCLYELATITLSLGKLEKARELYEKVLREYPGVAFRKDALYRQILAHYWDCSSAERDQEMTEKTLTLVQEFFKEFPTEVAYRESLETIEQYCYTLLFQAECLRMNFYLSRYTITDDAAALTAACMRFTYIAEKLLEHQKSLSSPLKDAVTELCVQLKELDKDNRTERYELLCQAVTLLATAYEN